MRKEKIVISTPCCGWSSISAPRLVIGFNWNTDFLGKLLKAAEEYADGRDTKIAFYSSSHEKCEIILCQGAAAVIKSSSTDAKNVVFVNLPG